MKNKVIEGEEYIWVNLNDVDWDKTAAKSFCDDCNKVLVKKDATRRKEVQGNKEL